MAELPSFVSSTANGMLTLPCPIIMEPQPNRSQNMLPPVNTLWRRQYCQNPAVQPQMPATYYTPRTSFPSAPNYTAPEIPQTQRWNNNTTRTGFIPFHTQKHTTRKTTRPQCTNVERWEEMFNRLVAFKKEHGHCNVRQRNELYGALGHWVNAMRGRRKTGDISQERIKRLDSIGFVWRYREAVWEKRYEQLSEFVQEFGHCNVPTSWDRNPKLGRWVQYMRKKYHTGKLSKQHFERLRALGLEWIQSSSDAAAVRAKEKMNVKRSQSPKTPVHIVEEEIANETYWPRPTWFQRHAQLVEFTKKYGHSKVPYRWEDNPGLGRWVSLMRKKKKDGKLDPHKEAMLNDLNFSWNLLGYRTRLEKRESCATDTVSKGWTFITENTTAPLIPLLQTSRKRKLSAVDDTEEEAPAGSNSKHNPPHKKPKLANDGELKCRLAAGLLLEAAKMQEEEAHHDS